MDEEFARETEERLVRYAAIDTQSDEASDASPSTACQLDLLALLVEELTAIGATDVRMTGYGAVLATIPGTVAAPTVGFLAHVDTAPQYNATGVRPVVHRRYNGGAITFGWSSFPQDGENALSLYRAADERLYARKLVRGRRHGTVERLHAVR